MSVPGVRIRALRKSFRTFRRTHEVLEGIDLDVAPGEVVGLIGPNGAGKTTLMSCLLGFLHPDGGEIAIDGRANDDLDVRRRTGFVPERMAPTIARCSAFVISPSFNPLSASTMLG